MVRCLNTTKEEKGKGQPKDLTVMVHCHKTDTKSILCRLTLHYKKFNDNERLS